MGCRSDAYGVQTPGSADGMKHNGHWEPRLCRGKIEWSEGGRVMEEPCCMELGCKQCLDPEETGIEHFGAKFIDSLN